jgi:hypothetical protein
MNLQSMESDLGRWHMRGTTGDLNESIRFKDWMDRLYPDCVYRWCFNNGIPYWEIRGGDTQAQVAIIMAWQDE